MRRRGGNIRFAVKLGSALGILLFVLWAGSMFLGFEYGVESPSNSEITWAITIDLGRVHCFYQPLSSNSNIQRFWEVYPPQSWNWEYTWHFHHETWNPGWEINVPLWMPLLLAAGATALLFWRSRRRYPGYCVRCGYSLTGNTSGVCPECGEPITSALDAPAR
jgi:hypothetical protein